MSDHGHQPSAIVYGVNAVLEALRGGGPVERIYLAHGRSERMRRDLLALARQERVPVQPAPRARLDRLASGRVHQGVVAVVAATGFTPLDDVLQKAQHRREILFLLLLDGVQDPGNMGAIIRSAEAGGVHGVVIPERRSVGLTPTVAKSSAGALMHLPVARVKNMARTIRQLQAEGIRVVGGNAEAPTPIYRVDLTGPLALVVGGEGRGLRRLVAAACDVLVSIPLAGRVGSLNASVAAGVMIFEALRQRSAGQAKG